MERLEELKAFARKEKKKKRAKKLRRARKLWMDCFVLTHLGIVSRPLILRGLWMEARKSAPLEVEKALTNEIARIY